MSRYEARVPESARNANARILGMIGNLNDNPRVAEILGIACAYEVYSKVNPATGYPDARTGYVVVLRADGPYVLYVDAWDAPTHADAVRLACEKACSDVAAEIGVGLPIPAPAAGVEYEL